MSTRRWDWWANAAPATAASSTISPPHENMVDRAPKWSMSQPTAGPPMACPPSSTRMYTLITRPRSVGAEESLDERVGTGEEQQGQQAAANQERAEEVDARRLRRHREDRPESAQQAHQGSQPDSARATGRQQGSAQRTDGGQGVEQAVATDAHRELRLRERREDHRHVETEDAHRGHENHGPRISETSRR